MRPSWCCRQKRDMSETIISCHLALHAQQHCSCSFLCSAVSRNRNNGPCANMPRSAIWHWSPSRETGLVQHPPVREPVFLMGLFDPPGPNEQAVCPHGPSFGTAVGIGMSLRSAFVEPPSFYALRCGRSPPMRATMSLKDKLHSWYTTSVLLSKVKTCWKSWHFRQRGFVWPYTHSRHTCTRLPLHSCCLACLQLLFLDGIPNTSVPSRNCSANQLFILPCYAYSANIVLIRCRVLGVTF